MDNKKLLSICIPIYNRRVYLEKMLIRFLEEKELFNEKIELIVSDNHSNEDLQTVAESFKKRGLKLDYYRQEKNLGADNNFLFCFSKAKGKYCWLLGSDDIPIRGFLMYLINQLENKDEYGLVFLRLYQNNRWFNREKTNEVYSEIIKDGQKMLSDISVWITFMSSSIIRTKYIKTLDLKKYYGTHLIQVPLYIKSCLSSDKNLLITYNYCFEADSDNVSKRGYNFYGVFVENMFKILQDFVDTGLFSKYYYERFKRIEYDYFLISYTKAIFANKEKKIHQVNGGFVILWKHYGLHIYAYFDLLKYVAIRIVAKLFNK